jgi:hypothetical protein
MRINKTTKSLNLIWARLDDASGNLYNALDSLGRMTDLSDETKKLAEMIDISRIDILKDEIEELLIKKERQSETE